MGVLQMGAGWKAACDEGFPATHRFYAGLRPISYPPLAGHTLAFGLTTAENQPGSHNLTGGFGSYLLALPAALTLRTRALPTFAYNVATDQPLWSWYVDASHYLTLLYTAADDKLTLRWADGGAERTLQSAAYASNEALQVMVDIDVRLDFAAGTGAILIDRVVVADTWSGAMNARASTFPTFTLRAETTTAGGWIVSHLRLFDALVATQAQLDADFGAVRTAELYWSLDGHGVAWERVNISRYVSRHEHTKEVKTKAGAISARSVGLTLHNTDGEWSDDQYADWSPEDAQFNGTTAQKYLRRRWRLWADNWYGHLHTPWFLGKITRDRLTRSSGSHRYGSVNAEFEDALADVGESDFAVEGERVYSGMDLCDTVDEADSILHAVIREAVRPRVRNYLGNSSFEGATIANSWTVGGTGAALTRVAGGVLGSYMGQLVYGSAMATLAEIVTFTGAKLLNLGEKWFGSILLRCSAAATVRLKIEERDSGGVNGTASVDISLAGGEGWTRFTISHAVTDATSDRLRFLVECDSNVTLQFDGAMLSDGDTDSRWYVTNATDGAAGVISADEAAEGRYDTLGFDVQSVGIEHPFLVVTKTWDVIEMLADATLSDVLGGGPSGEIRMRARLADNWTDPADPPVLPAARQHVAQFDGLRANAIIVHGVAIIFESAPSMLWNSQEAGFEGVAVANGAYWPPSAAYPLGVYCVISEVSKDLKPFTFPRVNMHWGIR